jgi:hypothetical protein
VIWAFILARLRVDDPLAATGIFVALSKRAFIAMVVLTGVTAVFGCLAVAASFGPQCPKYALMEEYQPQAFLGLALWSAAMAFMVSLMAWPTPQRREQIEQSFGRDVQLAYSDSGFSMTDGVLSAYAVLVALCGLSIAPVWIAIDHYLMILNNCQVLTTPH